MADLEKEIGVRTERENGSAQDIRTLKKKLEASRKELQAQLVVTFRYRFMFWVCAHLSSLTLRSV